MSTIPDRIYVDISDRELYDRVVKEGLFEGKTRKEQFLFAMSIGIKNGIKQSLGTRENFWLYKDARPEDEALLNAVALYDSDSLDVLSDKARVFEIAAEYAHAGIQLVVAKLESAQWGSFYKQFEKELHDLHGGLFSDEDNEENITS